MKTARLFLTVLSAACLTVVFATAAHAQATRTWVSGVGDDVNPCSRTAPCKTFAGAISKTASDGIINCLDSGGFGAVTITKAITIECTGVEAGVLSSGVQGIVVNAPSNANVNLRGLDIDGSGTTLGTNGINFINGGSLHVENTLIHNYSQNGILFGPNTTTAAAQLYVNDCQIRQVGGSSTTFSGIHIKPTAGANNVTVSINRTQVENSGGGIRADGTTFTGKILGAVRDTVVGGNTNNGITALSATQTFLMIDHCTVTGNNFGLVVNGAQAALFVNNTTVTTNNTGLFINVGGGTLGTYHNNFVNGNITTDGAFNLTLSPA